MVRVQTPKISSSLNTFKGFTVFCHENNINAYTHMLGMNRQKPNTAIMKKLELTPEDDVVYLKRLRHVNDKPVMIEHVSLPCSQFEFLLDVDMENQKVSLSIRALLEGGDEPAESENVNEE